MDDLGKQVGECIRKYRIGSNLSQETLAEHADITPNYLGLVERGVKNPTLHIIDQIAKALDISVVTLFEEATNGNHSSIEHLRIQKYLQQLSPEKVSLVRQLLETLTSEDSEAATTKDNG